MAEQFITLMADLDNESQKRMAGWYDELKQYGFEGKQTPDVPYHISLASFSLDKEKEVAAEVKKLAGQFAPIPVHISHIGMFAGGSVLFGAPDMNPSGLLTLHDAIRTETIDRYPWTPHSTILLDEPETIRKALPIFVKSFQPFLATITRLHLCAFWPTREIVAAELEKKQQILYYVQKCAEEYSMIFRLPELKDKDILQAYVQEHHDNQEYGISASLGLTSSDYSEWVEKISNNALNGDEQWGRSLLYLCFHEDRLVGLLNIRYELPESLSRKYGDIGYGVRPSERKKGYATKMLGFGLSVCREKGMSKVILGCYKDNLASAATITKNGGVLTVENDNYEEGRVSQYYQVKL